MMIDPKRVTKLKHDWSLVDYGVYEKMGVHEYRLLPPKWSVNFDISETQRDDRELEEWVRRAGEMLVDEILKNPHVKEAVDALIDRAKWEAYTGAYLEVSRGERYDFGSTNNE